MTEPHSRSSAASDIVDRLRKGEASGVLIPCDDLKEAADEIERLRHDLDRHMQIAVDVLNGAKPSYEAMDAALAMGRPGIERMVAAIAKETGDKIERRSSDVAQREPVPGDQASEGAIAQTFMDEDYPKLDSYGLARVMLTYWDVRWKAAQPAAPDCSSAAIAGAIKLLKETASHITAGRDLAAKVTLHQAYDVLIAQPQPAPVTPACDHPWATQDEIGRPYCQACGAPWPCP